jgi:hypothetical protein
MINNFYYNRAVLVPTNTARSLRLKLRKLLARRNQSRAIILSRTGSKALVSLLCPVQKIGASDISLARSGAAGGIRTLVQFPAN